MGTWVGFTLFRAPITSNSSLYSSPLLGSALPFFALQSLQTPVYILLRYLGRLYPFSRSNLFKLQSIFFSATWVGFTLFRAPITKLHKQNLVRFFHASEWKNASAYN